MPDNNELRELIISEVLSWVGTPYRFGCQEKNKGIDCARMGIVGYKEAGLIPKSIKLPHQYRDWIYGKEVDKDFFKNFIEKFAKPIKYQDILPADIVTFMVEGIEAHVGVVVSIDPHYIVHACSGSTVRKARLKKLKTFSSTYRHKALF